MEATLPNPPTTCDDGPALAESTPVKGVACFHCGEPCENTRVASDGKDFCCNGCLEVHRLLSESGLDRFYELSPHAGKRGETGAPGRWEFLDDPDVQSRVLDFASEDMSRVTFYVPDVHCIACVWLLENLFRLHPGIGQSSANFPRREVSIAFAPGRIKLSEVAALLASLGYPPQITLEKLDKREADPVSKKQWLQTGIAGFAFGNIMLASLPLYIGLDSFSGPFLSKLLGYVSLALALPVVTYSASDYWRSSVSSVRQRMLTLDVPIALGLAAIYGQSAYEILSKTGGGYLDSLCGLVFFLLCGRIFQRITHDRIAFDRDYRSFFPLATTRRSAGGDQSIPISAVRVGDRLLIRNGELIPADGNLVSDTALVDYSFVTGEAAPVPLERGARVYAGGKQIGAAIELETYKPVSQSYLTSLWDHKVFGKNSGRHLQSLTNAYSRRFTGIVIAIALLAGIAWGLSGDLPRGLKAFASVLIVACPCALALAAPFTLGTAQRILARLHVFVRNPLVLERMAEVNTIVFDKTGTLTAPGADGAVFDPADKPLSPKDLLAVRSLVAQSAHPHALSILDALAETQVRAVVDFKETPGQGIAGVVDNQTVELGSAKWLERHGVAVPDAFASTAGSVSHVAVGGKYLGRFIITQSLRADAGVLLKDLRRENELALLSGDNERERGRFQELLGAGASLLFNRNPVEKLEFVESLKRAGNRVVLMVGDGLNDAGAFKSADVGLALVDRIGVFSPASDVIMEARHVNRLHDILRLSKASVVIVRLSFGLSAAYNVVGISIAAMGVLSPVICAVLMPLSSLSVVLLATCLTNRAGRKLGMKGTQQCL